ncbi:MAG: BlaI/MecI/CopY family transcriptional regulator [Cytophagaceae bacterium]|nr:BlaI/MecI/CopY family transcriptional regulator [Gemmatimonadaceae bacterium]
MPSFLSPMDHVTLGDRELDVMAVLWEIGSGTVGEVREQLDVTLAYTTVLTILRNLEAKAFVSHEEEGRAHRYYPRVARQSAQRSALARLVNTLFHGSHEQLLVRLLEDRAIGADELRRLSKRVRDVETTRRKPQ